MPTDTEISDRFWKELKSERTIMLGLDGAEGGGMKPMTAMIEGDEEEDALAHPHRQRLGDPAGLHPQSRGGGGDGRGALLDLD